MPPYFAWQALHGQGWPATAEQEKVLVEDLRRAAPAGRSLTETPRRTAVTALLNALRCGVTYRQMLSALPALDPVELAAAHDYLTEQLTASRTHFAALVADPAQPDWEPHHAAAAQLMPIPVHRIGVLLGHVTDPDRVARGVRRVVSDVERITRAANSIEDKLADRPAGSPSAIRLGRSLHDGSEPGVWTHPYFMPTRVGQLSPTRVRDLYAAGADDDSA